MKWSLPFDTSIGGIWIAVLLASGYPLEVSAERINALGTGRFVCYDHADLAAVGGLFGFVKSTK